VRVIDAALAVRLVAEQFPEWAHLPVTPVELSGWDNRTFRLGDTMSIRLPSAEAYVPSVEKELTGCRGLRHGCRSRFPSRLRLVHRRARTPGRGRYGAGSPGTPPPITAC